MKDKLKRINNALFEHKGIHNHYIIPFENQTQEVFEESIFIEAFDLGIAIAQAHYAKQFPNNPFWKPFNTKEHIEKCNICNGKVWDEK